MNDVLNRVVDTVTDKPFIIKVDIKPRYSWQRWLMKYKLLPRVRTYTVHPIVLANIYRISKELLAIKQTTLSNEKTIADASYVIIEKHHENVARIVWIGLHNCRREPTKKDVRYILHNFNAKELKLVYHTIVTQMNLTDFISSIFSINGANILEEKPVSATSAEKNGESPVAQGS
jgi:hypothetical protein